MLQSTLHHCTVTTEIGWLQLQLELGLHSNRLWLLLMHCQTVLDTFQQINRVFCMRQFKAQLPSLKQDIFDLWVLSPTSELATVQCEVLPL